MKAKLTLFTALAGLALTAEAQDSAEWEWTLAPYLWASDVSLDLTVNNDTGVGGDADFKDLLDKVDAAFMGHLEARRGQWGLYLDTIYLDLSDSTTIAVGPGGPILDGTTADAAMKMKLFDAGGIYRLRDASDATQFDLLAGVRYIDLDVDALLTLPGPGMNMIDISAGPSETDVMLGARMIRRFAERWHWAVRADLSFGGTEGTYNGLATVGYTFGQSDLFTLTGGYRYMSIEIDGTNPRGAPTALDITLSGPLLGFVFTF